MAEGPISIVGEIMDNEKTAIALALMTPEEKRVYKENKIASLKKQKEKLIYKSMLLTLRMDMQKFYDERDIIKQKEMDAKLKTNAECSCSLSSSPDEDPDSLFEHHRDSFPNNFVFNSFMNDRVKRFDITVRVIGRQTRPIVVSITRDYTVIKIKEQLWGKIPARPSRQKLFYEKFELNDDRTVYELGIDQLSVLSVSVQHQ